MKVKIMVDSASDINNREAQELGIIMVPMSITFGDEEYYDGVNLLPAQFYEKLAVSNILPKTSQINAFRWEEEYEKALKDCDELVVITISSKLSATYNSAVQASKRFNGKVFVVDSMNACVGERLLCQYAIRLLNDGKSAKEIFDNLNNMKSKINVIAVIGTLDYLKKGGRISSAVAFAGKLLAIKPVIAVIEGEVKLIGKAMGSKNGYNLLNKLVNEKGGINFDMPFGIVWSGIDNGSMKKFEEDYSHLWKENIENVPEYVLGGTIGAHIGSGAVGVAFFEK